MKKLLKKNQIIITALVIMIAVAGYLNYTQSTVEQLDQETAKEENGTLMGAVSEDEDIFTQEEGTTYDLSEEIIYTDTVEVSDTGEVVDNEETSPGEAVMVSTTIDASYFSSAKLTREQSRAKNKEILMELMSDENITKAQKKEAMDEILKMTDAAEKESAAEILLESKGFSDVVVSMVDDGVDVIVNAESLTTAQMAQIEDIVKRKTKVEPSNIVISPVKVEMQE